jgi:hypothetical protein
VISLTKLVDDDTEKFTLTIDENFYLWVTDNDDDGPLFLIMETLQERFRLVIPTTRKKEVAELVETFFTDLQEMMRN